jgi:hypothetical protein
LLTNLTTVNRFAVVLLEPFDKLVACSIPLVVTVSRLQLQSIDRTDPGLVLLEVPLDQKESFSAEVLVSFALFNPHF